MREPRRWGGVFRKLSFFGAFGFFYRSPGFINMTKSKTLTTPSLVCLYGLCALSSPPSPLLPRPYDRSIKKPIFEINTMTCDQGE